MTETAPIYSTVEERAKFLGIPTADLEVIERGQAIAADLLSKNPRLPSITASIMGGDAASAEHWMAEVRAGRQDYERARVLVGSFARMDALLRLQEEGFATRDHLLDIWPEEWPFADPDDTDPRFVAVWIEAWRRNGRQPVRDIRRGRLPRTKTIPVYRGQPPGSPIGCSWSLDRKIAERFARGAWARTPVAEGEMITMDASRSSILAFLTGRNESEVIIDPRTVVRVP